MMASVSLDIVIVNWNSGKYLHDCLVSIVNAEKSGFRLTRVVVVDNASSDGSFDTPQALDLPLTIIRNSENRGFSAACNQGAEGGKADYLLFLNPDTLLFSDTLRRAIDFMQQPKNAAVGICGVRLVDDFGTTTISCARFPSLKVFFGKMTGLARLFPKTFPSHLLTADECQISSEVDQVIGAFFLVRRSVYEALGGFDERFFVYFEEVDFSWRAKQGGFSSYYLADVLLYHKGGGSSDQVKAKRLFYSLRSRIQYAWKHFSLLESVTLLVLTVTIEPMARILEAFLFRSRGKLGETVLGYGQLFCYFIGRARK